MLEFLVDWVFEVNCAGFQVQVMIDQACIVHFLLGEKFGPCVSKLASI